MTHTTPRVDDLYRRRETNARVIVRPVGAAQQLGELNRANLRRANVFTVSVVGGPGCGKTSLIDKTVQGLTPGIHVGVIAGDMRSHRDADLVSRHSEQVVQVTTGDRPCLDAGHVRDALGHLDLRWIDLLLIENVGTLTAPADRNLGQDVTAVVFSVAAGDDKAEKHPDLVRAADVVLINKIDLRPAVPFDLEAFHSDVRRINPSAAVFELSPLYDRGMPAWLDWLKARVTKRGGSTGDAAAGTEGDASLYFG